MHPILFHIGDLSIHAYGLLSAIGFLWVAVVAITRGRTIGVEPERTADLIFWTALIALAGSRIVFVLQNPEEGATWRDWVNIRNGGLVFYGALLAGLPAGSLLMRRYDMPFFAMWDIFATAFPVAHGITRIGCLAAGCCWGLPTDLPWAVSYDHPAAVGPAGVTLHPVQLYEAAWLFLIGGIVHWFYTRKQFHGQVMLVYLILYAVGRSVLELWRGDESRGFFLPQVLGELMTYSQGISALILLGAIAVFYVGARRAAVRAAIGASIQGPRT